MATIAEKLVNYRLQLQQVEAALLSDPLNEELHKLKSDLEEVIELTQDLEGEASGSTDNETSSNRQAAPEAEAEESPEPVKKDWKVGDKCLAIWSEDGQYYEATIDEITEDGDEVSVIFDAYKNADVTTLALLREISSNIPSSSDRADLKRKQTHTKQREYQKKKKQKKLQRFKQLEEERETEKNKWLAFANKKKGGLLKKSIFASPDSVTGRVGIGTCGIGGRPMTEFVSAEKWRKGV